MTVSPEEASDAGQATIEHVVALFEGTFTSVLKGRKETDAMRQWCVGGHEEPQTVYDPTLIAYSPYFDSSGPLSRCVARDFRTEAAKEPKPTPAQLEESRALFAVLDEVVRVMNKGGVTMLTGSDVAASRVIGRHRQDRRSRSARCRSARGHSQYATHRRRDPRRQAIEAG